MSEPETQEAAPRTLLHSWGYRRVTRVALAYVAIAWVVLQAGDVVFKALLVPDWALRLLLALLALGFPLAVVLSLFFEVTPDGVRRAGESSDTGASAGDTVSGENILLSQPPADRTHVGRATALGIGALVVAGLLGAWWLARSPVQEPVHQRAAPKSDPTLIVMPLKPIGGSADQDIAAGLSDELISSLARVEGLRVIARESTGIAAAQAADMGALVARLGISHALEGSLRQSGEQLRIHVRLIDAVNGRMLWTEDYDRDVADVLAIEREIANAVAASLRLKLGLPTVLAARGGDAEFQRRYQKVRALLRGSAVNSNQTLEMAEGELRALVKLRPQDARAHATLALVLHWRAFRRPTLAAALRAEAIQEAMLARVMDSGLPEPYTVLAGAACRSNQWEGCLELIRKARSLASDSSAHWQYALSLATLGYLDQARDVLERAIARDPLNSGLLYGYGRVLDTIGEHQLAHQAFARVTGSNPYGPWYNAVWRRDYADALRIAHTMGENPGDREHGPRLERNHVAASIALVDPVRWSEAKAAGLAFEAETGLMDFLRVFHPDPDAAAIIKGFEKARKRAYSTWDLLLWNRDLPYIRRHPVFQDYLRDNGILDHWHKHGFPKQCRAKGEGAVCD